MKLYFLLAIYISFGLIGAIQNKGYSDDFGQDDVVSSVFQKSVAFRFADHKLKLNRIPLNYDENLDGNFSYTIDLNLYQRFEAQPTFWQKN